MIAQLGQPKMTFEAKPANEEAEAAIDEIPQARRCDEVFESVREERTEGMKARLAELKEQFGDRFPDR